MKRLSGKYKLFFAGNDGTREQIGLAVSDDLSNWKMASDSPIIGLGASGRFDSVQTSNPCVVRTGGVYRLFYQAKDELNRFSIGSATSADLVQWNRSKRPIVQVSIPDGAAGKRNGCHHPHVIQVGDVWRLYFVVQVDQVTEVRVCESKDLEHFELLDVVCLRQEGRDESRAIYYPWIMTNGSNFTMWYSAVNQDESSSPRWKLLRAESRDGFTWTRDREPLEFSVTGEGGVRPSYFANPCVLDHLPDNRSRYSMIFHGRKDGAGLDLGLAASMDGKMWDVSSWQFLSGCRSGWNSRDVADPFLLVDDVD